jgi:predicted phosphodiesterase
MRRLLISDIHSNTEALDACLKRAEAVGFDAVLCCGDLVGYGPEPNEAVAKVRALNALVIRGNHDRVACGQDDPTDFNPHAKAAAYWTREALSKRTSKYLEGLPVGPLQVDDTAQLVHGAVTDEDDYIMSERDAAESFALTEKPLTFFGHSHFPAIFTCDQSGNVVAEFLRDTDGSSSMQMLEGMQYLVNPGSVGQPRDGDTRSSFLIWDTEERRLEFYRVDYPFEITQEKMKTAGLPRYLIDRLSYGR